jgi:hypothetical protein
MGSINVEVDSNATPFVVVGDPNALEIKSFWVNVKCVY